MQGGKCPLTEMKLAQRLSHATEFSEGICKQTRELKLNLESSKLAIRSCPFQQAHQPACTCAAYSASVVAKQKNKQVGAESQGWCGSRLEATASAGLPVQHLLCVQHHTRADLLSREPCSRKHSCRLLPSQGCSSQMLRHRKGL